MRGMGGHQDASPVLSLHNKEAQMFVVCKSICCKHVVPEDVREECVSLEGAHIVGDMQKYDREKGWLSECVTTSSSFNIRAICCSFGRKPHMDGWMLPAFCFPPILHSTQVFEMFLGAVF